VKTVFNYKGKKIEIELKKCEGFEKFSGLMFKSRESASALLFDFGKNKMRSIHSFFCPEFVAIWLDKENKVVEVSKISPWRFSIMPSGVFSKLIEIPVSEKYGEVLEILGRK
tara:strand:+ start:61 stop:396 length:336 start_codon:yes stop_codon:yes gene_type:complete